jgi:Protein of unknown function (DUF2852)
MGIAAKVDEMGKLAWIVLTVLAFMLWWPIGLAILAFAIGSGRMACGMKGRFDRWMDGVVDAGRSEARRHGFGRSSGNRAFDEYRAETMRRLEEEEREFRSFLERLRQAKDKAEFDQFMSDRRRRFDETQPA